jgi:ribosomal protein L11 methylase PrmA
MEIVYSMMWLIKPKKYNNNQSYADNHLGKRSKRRYNWMRNKEQYLHTLSKGHRFWVELLVNVHYTVQIHPC